MLILFLIWTKLFFNIFCFDTGYDHRVSGFILCDDSSKITFLRAQASALVLFFFFATSRNFKDKNILT